MLAGQTLDIETKICQMDTFVHKLDSKIELVEDDGLVDMGFRDGPDLNDALGDNAEVSLMTEDEFVDIGSRTNSGGVLNFLDCPDRSGHFNSDNNIVNVAIPVLFHA